MDRQIQIFSYIKELDAFIPNKVYKEIAERLGLTEWTYVNWIGRLFCMDNDYGEHWFDNWDERDLIHKKATAMGYDSQSLYIINPDRFKDGRDGACHTDKERKLFWTDVCKSLTISLDTLYYFAVENNPLVGEDDHLPIRKRIKEIELKYGND
jgi:hypothetical protein